jgi:hypothetical protein
MRLVRWMKDVWFPPQRKQVNDVVDPWIDQFRDGLATLRRDGEQVGHIATSVGHYWNPLRQPWIWLVVRWGDGLKERAAEDHAPWTYVAEMRDGFIEWDGSPDAARNGRYDVEWLAPAIARAELDRLGIRPEDF